MKLVLAVVQFLALFTNYLSAAKRSERGEVAFYIDSLEEAFYIDIRDIVYLNGVTDFPGFCIKAWFTAKMK